MGELLGSLGLAWPRLLIYPGGLAAMGLAWLLARWMWWASGPHPQSLSRQAGEGGEANTAEISSFAADFSGVLQHPSLDGEGQEWGEMFNVLPPLLALALLPLPPARSFPYGIDLMVALALMGWPRLRGLAARGGLAGVALRTLLPGYGMLLLGGGLMSAGAGGGELSRLARAPDAALGWALLLGGSGLWLAGQARLYAGDRGWAERLGELGHLWVGALPILAALAAGAAGRMPAGWPGWALPPLALVVAGLILGALRRWTP